MRYYLTVAAMLTFTVAAVPAEASSQVSINDASLVQYAIVGNKVFFRNMNEFDSAWLGCCYNYSVDLSSDGGKAMYSAFLTAAASRTRIVFYKEDPSTAGAIYQMGWW